MPVKFTQELISSSRGRPPLGCRYCDRGSKLVLYITGICRCSCFYCPLSEEKKGKDVIYANERRIEGPEWLDTVVEEAVRMSSLGTGITGGDPLVFPERTLSVIRRLKEIFGKGHHIHLYTSMVFSHDLIDDLAGSGLDEIRFHPPLEIWGLFRYLGPGAPEGDPGPAASYHDMIIRCMDRGIDTGIEVPSIPRTKGGEDSQGLHDMVSYALRSGIDFMNINELESSHTNSQAFGERGYRLVEDSMAVSGSRELALMAIDRGIEQHPGTRTVLHFCSSVYKDSVQLRNRLRRTAKNVRRPYEIVTDDGTLLAGVIVTPEPMAMRSYLLSEHGVPEDLMEAYPGSVRIAPWILSEIADSVRGTCYISERYPTWDALEVERIPL